MGLFLFYYIRKHLILWICLFCRLLQLPVLRLLPFQIRRGKL